MERIFDRIVSADSHMMEPSDLWVQRMGDEFGEATPQFMSEYEGRQGRFFNTGYQVTRLGDMEKEEDAKVTRRMREAGYVPEARIAYQDEDGVDAEVLNPTWMLMVVQGRDRRLVRAACQAYNDWLAEFCSHSPKRLIGTPVIPIDDVQWGVNELYRTTKNGLKGALINLDVPEGAAPYQDSVYDGFWSALQELDAPATVHVLTGRQPSPFNFHRPDEYKYAPRALAMVLTEIMPVLANEFIYGGILDRFPKLRLVCAEFEISWIPWFMFHLDDTMGALAARLGLPHTKIKPSEYMQSRIWHGFIDDPFALDAVPHIGAEQVLWGTDFPHPGSIGLGTQGTAQRTVAGLPDEQQRKIVADNAVRVWNL